jgi:hypothetical protein
VDEDVVDRRTSYLIDMTFEAAQRALVELNRAGYALGRGDGVPDADGLGQRVSKHRKPKARPPKRPSPDGDLVVRARTAELLWRVAHAARAISWAPEMEDCGAAAYAVLDDAVDDLDAR